MASQTAEIQYQLEHWADDRGPAIIAGSIALIVITFFAVVLRLVAQKLIKPKFDIDDYLILGALVGFYVLFSREFSLTRNSSRCFV